jgi:hypothetical protein
MTVRIFIGCSGNDEDLEFQAVLHYSLEKHASEPLDITWMRLSRDPSSFWFADPQRKLGWRTDFWATPFSALRWGIPAFCNFEGKAIYLDVDMIAMADIAELWHQELTTGAMLSKLEDISTSVYDNAKMAKFLPPIEQIKEPFRHRDIRRKMQSNGAVQRYKGNWNCLDMRKDRGGEYASLNDPDIKLLHFTEIPTQPHLRHAIPRLAAEGRKHWYTLNKPRWHHRKDAIEFFDRMLSEASEHGYRIENYRNPTPFGDYGRGR